MTAIIPIGSSNISASLIATFVSNTQNQVTSFAQMNETLSLTSWSQRARLLIQCIISFPGYYDKDSDKRMGAYFQPVNGSIDNITISDEGMVFPWAETKLQGNPWHVYNSMFSKLVYAGGNAIVSAKDPFTPVVQITINIASTEASFTNSKTTTVTDPSRKESVEGGLIAKAKFEYQSEIDSQSRVSSTTSTQLPGQATWTLYLQLPKPKPAASPVAFPYSPTCKIYFETGKSNADHYRSQLNNNVDQIQVLQTYMDKIDKGYGIENIESVKIFGSASGLGDTRNNIHLSADRADYIKKLLTSPHELNLIKIPPDNINKGAPIGASHKENNPEERYAEIKIMIKGGTKRR